MPDDKLFFKCLKEARGDYVVTYDPPNPGYRFSTLNLTYTCAATSDAVAEAMEAEAKHWLERFPVPVMVSAFDPSGTLFNLRENRPENHLLAFVKEGESTPTLHWRLLKDEEIPETALSREDLLNAFDTIPYKTSTELGLESAKRAKEIRLGVYVIVFWVAVVPAIVAVLEFFSPIWVAVLVLLYSLWRAYTKALMLLGRRKKSPKELQKEEEERTIRHHHYHCEQNPEGFLRLKLENLERWEKERIQEEAAELRKGSSDKAG